VNSLYSPSDIKYIYIFILKFSNLFISESSSTSMSDISKEIDIKMFLKSKDNDIYPIIVTLRFIFIILAFF